MPTELEELVEFLHHGNTQIRQTAAENLLPYSKIQPAIFKTAKLIPVKDLKLLVKDYAAIAKNALTILINISKDPDVLGLLAEDDAFLETLLVRVTNSKEPNADPISMLLANLSKSPSITRLVTLTRTTVPALSPSKLAVTQLLELFNKGAEGGYNPEARFDYLAWFFGDLAKDPAFVAYLTTPPSHSTLDPLTTFLPHTTSPSPIRRLGTASLLKNTALLHTDIPYLLQPAASVLPPILLPLCSSDQEALSEVEMDSLPEVCQYLGDEHVREKDVKILKIHLETLFLLSTRGGVEGARLVKESGMYPVIRELHLEVEDEGVRRGCERLVDVLMGDEAAGGSHEVVDGKRDGNVGRVGDARSEDMGGGVGRMVTQVMDGEEDDEDDEIVPIF
ncbi:hypothetical protein HO173_006723 [Letharia columbiana]|uniref:Protein HGH1 homolog n=1 Tax=Letharia columbiana TaxID=112416 RepID=A0A8H6FUV1_9LECA|nr:uncharacterized protein HO173_006723 [Letharia columbiana]KAF6235096.1 hypothetical protein HO173_006723 [Letharia columbiana]